MRLGQDEPIKTCKYKLHMCIFLRKCEWCSPWKNLDANMISMFANIMLTRLACCLNNDQTINVLITFCWHDVNVILKATSEKNQPSVSMMFCCRDIDLAKWLLRSLYMVAMGWLDWFMMIMIDWLIVKCAFTDNAESKVFRLGQGLKVWCTFIYRCSSHMIETQRSVDVVHVLQEGKEVLHFFKRNTLQSQRDSQTTSHYSSNSFC